MGRSSIVVIGAAKGGTTAVAGITRILGVYYGTHQALGEWDNHHEDVEFFNLLYRGNNKVFDLIRKRNNDSKVWGYKHPTLYKKSHYRDIMLSNLINPKFIFVTRDLEAIGLRRGPDKTIAERIADMTRLSMEQTNLLKWINENSIDYIFVSYEKLLINTFDTIGIISDFIETPFNSVICEKANRYIKAEAGYIDFQDFLNNE